VNNRNRSGNASKRAAAVAATLRGSWVARETVCLKGLGLTFRDIADQLTRIGRGEAQPLTAMPEGVSFPPDYRISASACHKAYLKLTRSEPALQVEALRALSAARCEEMYLSLQPALRKGDARAVTAAVKLLDHLAKLFGCYEAQQIDVRDTRGNAVSFRVMQEIAAEIDLVKSNPDLREVFTPADPGMPLLPSDNAIPGSDDEQIDVEELDDLREGSVLPPGAVPDISSLNEPTDKEKP
jgi:hypothetical protein